MQRHLTFSSRGLPTNLLISLVFSAFLCLVTDCFLNPNGAQGVREIGGDGDGDGDSDSDGDSDGDGDTAQDADLVADTDIDVDVESDLISDADTDFDLDEETTVIICGDEVCTTLENENGDPRYWCFEDCARIDHFLLINADDDLEISRIDDGSIISYSDLGTSNINIVAVTLPEKVGSVVFGFDENPSYRIENQTPYAIGGNHAMHGDYYSWTPAVGEHTISAIPFSIAGGTGTAGQARSITVTIEN